jgi:ribonuclease HI
MFYKIIHKVFQVVKHLIYFCFTLKFNKNLQLVKLLYYLSICTSAFNSLNFYTDGSLQKKDSGSNQTILMGVAWYNTKTEYTFKHKVTGIVSSTTPESLAILLVLEITPSNWSVNVYTNSQSVVYRLYSVIFGKYENTPILHIFKTSNWQIWKTIYYIIYLKNLLVSVIKIKVHSDNSFNNTADTLAKEGCYLSNSVYVYNNLAASRIHFALTNRETIIERNTRKFLKHITQNIHRGL